MTGEFLLGGRVQRDETPGRVNQAKAVTEVTRDPILEPFLLRLVRRPARKHDVSKLPVTSAAEPKNPRAPTKSPSPETSNLLSAITSAASFSTFPAQARRRPPPRGPGGDALPHLSTPDGVRFPRFLSGPITSHERRSETL